MQWLVTLFKLTILFTLSGIALSNEDARRGFVLADKYCTSCHDISRNGAFKLYPPSFASIAAYRSRAQIWSRIVLPPMHTNMPPVGFVLPPKEIEELVDYIQSLE